MKDINQKILKFDYDKILKMMIFMFQKAINIFSNFLNKWPKWEKNF